MTEIREHTERLLWSVWSEMGAPGGGRQHRRVVIDPEPLIAFSPHLARRDSRLLGLAFDWCSHNASKVSKHRLAGLAKLLPERSRRTLVGFNGALTSHGVRWRPAGTPLDLEPDRARVALPMERPALLAFRVRALAGVSARADVLLRLLVTPEGAADASSLTPPGTSRRNVERVLAELIEAGLVLVHGSPRRRRFRLSDPASLARTTGAEGLANWDWHRLLHAVSLLHAFVETAPKTARLRQIHAVKARKAIAGQTVSAGAELPPNLEGRADAFDALLTWGGEFTRRLADGEGPR